MTVRDVATSKTNAGLLRVIGHAAGRTGGARFTHRPEAPGAAHVAAPASTSAGTSARPASNAGASALASATGATLVPPSPSRSGGAPGSSPTKPDEKCLTAAVIVAPLTSPPSAS